MELADQPSQVVRQLVTGQVVITAGRIGENAVAVDGQHLRQAAAHLEDSAGQLAAGVQRQQAGVGDVQRRWGELLKEYTGRLFSVWPGVEGGLREEDWVILRGHAQFVLKNVPPDLLHLLPVGDDAVLYWVVKMKAGPLPLSIAANEKAFIFTFCSS